jgi:glycosyltransferase involved in cell wall biosynthesis
MKKIKILTLSDHPLSPSGVGSQTKYFIEALLKTGRYEVVSFGGAMKHDDYTPMKIEPWGDSWRIFPVDGYGNQEMIRSVMQKEKPDLLWFMTDPRFYGWLWEMENEVRAQIPMVYYHVWDNFPPPDFNADFYNSNDLVACISKVTHEIVKAVAPEVDSIYLPHAVNETLFHPPKTDEEKIKINELRDRVTRNKSSKKIFFWNNRNARRKQSGTLIWWFKEWLDKVGHDKAMLLMHTDARDPHGQDLPHIINKLGLTEGQVLLSTKKLSQQDLSNLYKMADYTINISDAEGFGLATLESLSCGTPIIVNMTGGLQEQVTDGKNWFGFGIEPASKTVIGSLQVPYIYEDRISQRDFDKTLTKALKLPVKKYKQMCSQGKRHVTKSYNFENFEKSWISLIDETVEKHGSWEERKNHKRWHLMEIK